MPKKIFYLIDDDPIFQWMVKKSVANLSEKIDMRIFHHGLKALRELRSIQDPSQFPDIIFLDLFMPILNGWEFIHEYQSLEIPNHKNIYLYMVSSCEDREVIDKAMDIKSLSGFFTKPINQEELNIIIEDTPRDYWDSFKKINSFTKLQAMRKNKLKAFEKIRML